MAGRRPVEEAFAARRPALRLLVTPGRRQPLERIVLHATTLRIPIIEVEGGSLTALAGFDGHQGVALVVEPRRFATTAEILARAIERGEPPFILVLDSLEDPQNLGTVLRSAEAAGVHGVLFPTARQAPLSPSAVKASAGATEHLLLCPVDDLAGALTDLHVRGVRVVGSEAEAPLTARQADLRGPLAIVVGSEGHGLSPVVRRRCDLMVRIPMRGSIGSLNAAVAGSVLLFEALGQRDPEARPVESSSPVPATKGGPRKPRKGLSAEVEPAPLIGDAATPVEPAAEPDDQPLDTAGPPAALEAAEAARPADAAQPEASPKPRKARARRAEPDAGAEPDGGAEPAADAEPSAAAGPAPDDAAASPQPRATARKPRTSKRAPAAPLQPEPEAATAAEDLDLLPGAPAPEPAAPSASDAQPAEAGEAPATTRRRRRAAGSA